MKKLALAMMFGAAAVSANAQISSVQMQVACNPQDVKHTTHKDCAAAS